jgi:hypothetical protein
MTTDTATQPKKAMLLPSPDLNTVDYLALLIARAERDNISYVPIPINILRSLLNDPETFARQADQTNELRSLVNERAAQPIARRFHQFPAD